MINKPIPTLPKLQQSCYAKLEAAVLLYFRGHIGNTRLQLLTQTPCSLYVSFHQSLNTQCQASFFLQSESASHHITSRLSQALGIPNHPWAFSASPTLICLLELLLQKEETLFPLARHILTSQHILLQQGPRSYSQMCIHVHPTCIGNLIWNHTPEHFYGLTLWEEKKNK